ncbi:hypothetical protein [Rhizobium leucaenae]|uniref:hypothetical protein n=1 Tax=Rhizobium leucaenae TaxID=29450 RepID=UPI00161901F4|nr:hypothetical protein [Rhizobium leucaenae]MBB6305531.1 hypothetical protein [Rhizobium leucaenae]
MTERIDDEEDVLKTFADVLHWMNDEGLIPVRSIQVFDGGYAYNGVQLTSKGVPIWPDCFDRRRDQNAAFLKRRAREANKLCQYMDKFHLLYQPHIKACSIHTRNHGEDTTPTRPGFR